jgi:hypothetical protein
MKMDRKYVSQHNVIERYLSGRLTEAEVAAFEERCLWCHETLDELEAAERLREGLREPGAAYTTTRPRGPLARLLFSPQWAAAASVMLVVSLATTGWLLTQQSHVPGLATAQVYSIEMTRGRAATSTVVRVGPADRWVVLLMYPDLGRHNRFRAELNRAGEASPVWQVSDIPPGTTESIALTLPAELLTAGDYRLRVTGLDEGRDVFLTGLNEKAPADPVGEVFFRVIAE